MAQRSPNIQWQRSIVLLSGTVIVSALVALLYWAQIVFIPLALAVLMTFLLTPVVRGLERRGLGRTPSVLLVMLITLIAFGGFTYLVTRQMGSLAQELTHYSANIQRKVELIREGSGNWDRFAKMLDDIAATWKPVPDGNADATVVLRPEASWLSRWPHMLGSAVEVAGGAGLVLVLTAFGLFKREDLRNRFLRLIGHRQLASTTKAVDEAGSRVSRYLLTQAAVNFAYGLILGCGLGLVGVKYALLWGSFAAVLRYIPYLGAWMSIVFPLVVSTATAETWTQPLATLGIFLALELVTYNVVEPLLFKRSMGVSEVAQLVSAAFWGFLWGPVGLILSAPLTVCLLVVGKYVPQFAFLDVLLGDDPPLETAVSLYQRLLAWDEDDATRLVNAQMKDLTPEQTYDRLLIPVLNFTKRDRIREEITEEDEEFILRATRDMVDDIAPAVIVEKSTAPRVKLLACPAADKGDLLALEMLQKVLIADRWDVDVVPTEVLAAELVERAVKEGYAVICIGSVPPGGLAHTRYLCKRLRNRLPNAKIIVGRWGRQINEENYDQLIEAGATSVDTTVEGTRKQLNTWLPVFAQTEAKSQTAQPASALVGDAREAVAAV